MEMAGSQKWGPRGRSLQGWAGCLGWSQVLHVAERQEQGLILQLESLSWQHQSQGILVLF